MIEVKNQYSFKVSITNFSEYSDFIAEEDLLSFTLIEEVGNTLPTFELNFKTIDERVYPLLHEGNTLNIVFGIEDQKIESTLAVTRLGSSRIGSNKRVISVKGLLDKLSYMNNSIVSISDSMSSVEYIIEKVSPYFKVDTNVKKYNDKMKWIQANKSNRKVVTDAWLHSYISDDSFLMLGVTSDGTFRIKDLKTDLKNQQVDWRFLPTPSGGSKDIFYSGDPVVETNTGFINNWLGYSRKQHVYDLDSDEEIVTENEMTPILALSRDVAKKIEVESKFASIGIINENCHSNYWKAYQSNLLKLSSLGNVKITISFAFDLTLVKVLDKVYFLDMDTGNGNASASEYFSGIYYVAKVSRTLTGRQIQTTVVLCREGLNQIKNTQ